MAKKYVVKVYSKTGAYLNTWDEIVSDIEFQNEINSAGGQMKITLARKAGDYGEGSDVDFGFKVTVTVIDKEAPTGLTIFQGYISSYTPIYKNDSVEVIILSYGSELNDFVIEGGEATDISDTLDSTVLYGVGNTDASGLDVNIAQTFTSTNTITLSTLEVYAKTADKYDPVTSTYNPQTNIGLYADVYTGSTPGSGTKLGTLYSMINDNILRQYKLTTTDTIALTASSAYYILYRASAQSTSSNYGMLWIAGASAYASGTRWSFNYP